MATAVLVAIGLSYGHGSTRHDHSTRPAVGPRSAPSAPRQQIAAIGGQSAQLGSRLALAPRHHDLPINVGAPPPHFAPVNRYRGPGYSLAYPSGWQVSESDRAVASYRRTVLEGADGAAKVTVDYSPGERIDPASKAFQIEAATSITPGYHRISFGPTTVDGRAAFAWEFVVADADPRRADLFIRTPSGGVALLAHGLDFARARSAARSIAGSVSGMR
jgi:hypothetical protein